MKRRKPVPRRSLPALLFALLSCCGWSSAADSQTLAVSAAQPHITRQVWMTENGLPQNSVHALAQTPDGFLWLATEGGLARFDGFQFTLFDRESNPALPDNDVRCLFVDRSGALWAGTATGLTRLQGESVQTFTPADGLPGEPVRSMLESEDGMLWVLTASSLAAAELKATDREHPRPRFHTYSEFDGMLTGEVLSMAAAAGGGVWAGTSRGLNHVSGSKAQPGPPGTVGMQPGPPGTVGMPIDALAVSLATDSLLLATPDALLRLENGRLNGRLSTLGRQPTIPMGGVRTLLETADGIWAAGKNSVTLIRPRGIASFAAGRELPGAQVQTLMQDRHGAVWIATNGGLAHWVSGHLEPAPAGDTASSKAVLSLLEDREGDLWVGTETAGVEVRRERLFGTVGREQGLLEETVTSLLEAADGTLWVGTNGGGLSRLALGKGPARTYRSGDGLASDTVLALATGQGGPRTDELWVGTPDGLNHLEQGRWTTFTSADGLADDLVRSLLVTRDGALWAGTRHGVTRLDHGRATTWTTQQGLGSDLVGAMVEDPSGDLWIGTLGGLTRLHDGKLRNYTTADGLPSNVITALEVASGGGLWIGTNGAGLAHWDGSRMYSFGATAGLPREIYSVLEDRLGSLWMSSDHGIYRVPLAALEQVRAGRRHEFDAVHFGTADGLQSLEGSGAGHPSAWRLADGRLCFASRRGVVVVDPARLPATIGAAPPVVIERVAVDDRTETAEELRSIAPGPSHFSFAFAGISLAAPQRVQYRYRLEGFDRDWMDAGTRRSAFYTNIPPGRYRFRVEARSEGGAWGEPGASAAFELRPRFVQTAWFKALLALLLGLALLAVYRLRMRTLKSRFDAVGAERSRLAREIHDTLAQGFVAVSVHLEVVSQMLKRDDAPAARQQLDQTRSMVRESLAEARRSIWNLRSGVEAESLPARLAQAVRQVVAQGAGAQLETTGIYRPLDRRIEDEIFRIAQEAIANAVRHAGAATIRIRLGYAARLLELEILDDGRGFDPAVTPAREQGHYGLTGIRERAREIDAAVILKSAPGQGTTVRVEVPLRRAARAKAGKDAASQQPGDPPTEEMTG